MLLDCAIEMVQCCLVFFLSFFPLSSDGSTLVYFIFFHSLAGEASQPTLAFRATPPMQEHKLYHVVRQQKIWIGFLADGLSIDRHVICLFIRLLLAKRGRGRATTHAIHDQSLAQSWSSLFSIDDPMTQG